MEMSTSLYYIGSESLANWNAFVHVHVIGQELCFSLGCIRDHKRGRWVWLVQFRCVNVFLSLW